VSINTGASLFPSTNGSSESGGPATETIKTNSFNSPIGSYKTLIILYILGTFLDTRIDYSKVSLPPNDK